MRVQTFQELESAYQQTSQGLDKDDLNERSAFLKTHPYSVIIEGEYSEFENLNQWISKQINNDSKWKHIYFGKTDYDFGFVEYFLTKEKDMLQLKEIVPFIFTTYPLSLVPNTICRSNGYNLQIDYDSSMEDALIYP
ncbi:hypothetical protein D3C71_892420 [compost metagenome]